MRSSTTSPPPTLALVLLSLLSFSLATPSDSPSGGGPPGSGGPPPTTPAPPPPGNALPPTPIEACLAPPSAQAANRAYAHWLAHCQVTRPCAAATGAEGERTAYTNAEVEARREEYRPEWAGVWPEYTPRGLLEVAHGERAERARVEGAVAFPAMTTGELNVDATYADFLAGIEAIGTPQARLGLGGRGAATAQGWARTGAATVPDCALPVLIIVASILLRVAGVGSRNRGGGRGVDGVEEKRIERR
ncbi:hypothetical protein RQP46_003967 [Phenoliferia psychrophenolica]